MNTQAAERAHQMVSVEEGSWPDFIGVGAAKCGTTSLYRCLEAHPEVFMSPIKEPNHFSTDIYPDRFRADYRKHEREKQLDIGAYVQGPMIERHWGAYVKDPGHYRTLFRNAGPGQLKGEISNSYLYSETAAAEIKTRCPEARLFMILRNPADRAFSHYQANLRDGRAIRPFREEIEADMGVADRFWGGCHLYVDLGMYATQVERFLDVFPPSSLRIYLYDDLRQDPGRVVADLYEFLGADSAFPPPVGARENQARAPRFPRLVYAASRLGIKKPLYRLVPERFRKGVKDRFFRPGRPAGMSPQDRAWLTAVFRDDIRRLQRLIDRDLEAWLA